MVYVFERIYEHGLYAMHDLSLILGCMRSVIVFKQIGIVGKDVDGNVLYCFKL